MVEPDKRRVAGGPADWEKIVTRPEDACARCERAFAMGDEYVGVLAPVAEGSFERLDVCPNCLEADETLFAYWRGKRRSEDEKRGPRRLDMNFLTDFFKRLQDHQDEERYVQVGYIVSLVLLRKKILVHRGQEQDDEGRRVMVFVFKKDEDQTEYRIVEPELTAERIESIRDDLAQVFNLDDDGAKPVKGEETAGEGAIEPAIEGGEDITKAVAPENGSVT